MKALTNHLKESLIPLEPKVCIDLSDEVRQTLFSVFNAYREREDNILNEITGQSITNDLVLLEQLNKAKGEKSVSRLFTMRKESQQKLQEIAMHKFSMWENGRTLNVRFLGGTGYLHKKVKHYASIWEEYANIHFNFIENGEAQIRISFQIGMGSWSHVGTNNLNITDQTEATMNFGWLDEFTNDDEFSCVILHEFGHALGCIHEHQVPESGLEWNTEYIYNYYKRTENWNKEKVNHNILYKYNSADISNSEYDPTSIMHYDFPEEFFKSKHNIQRNFHLSEHDIEFIKEKYPKE